MNNFNLIKVGSNYQEIPGRGERQKNEKYSRLPLPYFHIKENETLVEIIEGPDEPLPPPPPPLSQKMNKEKRKKERMKVG